VGNRELVAGRSTAEAGGALSVQFNRGEAASPGIEVASMAGDGGFLIYQFWGEEGERWHPFLE
jgi:hypothetical protein